jgi:hypothetical protein
MRASQLQLAIRSIVVQIELEYTHRPQKCDYDEVCTGTLSSVADVA